MSRSRKHLPIRGIVPADTEKPGKRRWHRALRRRERQRLATLPPEWAELYLTFLAREVSAELAKRGKEFVTDPVDAWLALRK